MARAIWSGAVRFGLVHIPVRLYTAVQSKQVSFNQFQKGTGQRIRYRRVAEDTGEEVDWEDIVKGYPIEKGRYVMISPEELGAIEPRRTRTIDIEEFVDLGEIDPISWNKTYYVGPEANVGAEKSYSLLRRAMEETGKVAIGRFVMRTKQYLATIRPMEGILGLETMYYADEIRGREQIESLPEDTSVSSRELGMAEQLIGAMTSAWKPEKYRDTYRERVLELVEKKSRGEAVVLESAPEEPRMIDIMEALRGSLQATRARPAAAGKQPGPRDDYASMSKKELYERAAVAEIPGRSKMTKPELIEALEKVAS